MALRRDRGYAFIDDNQSPASPPPTAPAASPPTAYVLSTEHQHHQARVQGRLMAKSLSATNDESEPNGKVKENDNDNSGHTSSQDPPNQERTNKRNDSSAEPPAAETLRSGQKRGFGIGGVGNIRRPTEVLHFYSSSDRTVADRDGQRQGKRRWQWMNTLLRRKDRSSHSYEKY